MIIFVLTCLVDYYSHAEEYDGDGSFESLEEESTNLLKCHRQKVLTIDTWSNISPKEVGNIPYDIDGLCVFVVKDDSNTKIQEKCKDGRPWQQNSRTKWRNFDSVRYKNCSGGLICPNYQCPYREKFSLANQINFEKNRLCSLYGATGEKVERFVRKYIAMKGKSAHLYHYGQHQCRPKLVQQRQADIIAQAMKSNQTIKTSAIQSVLTALRSREPLNQVFNIAKKVTDRRKISNEKI